MRTFKDVSYAEHKDCLVDIFLPDEDEFTVMVYFHGGGLEAGSRHVPVCIAEYLTARNIAFVSVEYRMYPDAKYPDFLVDCAAAVAWVKEHISEYGKCKGIYAGGSSAGGYISMMLCFDKKYLNQFGMDPMDLDGYIHDAGQPTCHFNVCRERGLDTRRIIVDESAMLYHIGTSPEYAPMMFIVSDDDIENRYEQTMLAISTMKHFEYKAPVLKVMHGTHCHYVEQVDENNESVFGKMIYEFISQNQK